MTTRRLLSLLLLAAASPAFAFSVDGEGHYAVRGATQTSPGFSRHTGFYQAIEQSFSLLGEARFNDMSSMYLELGLFDNPREAYLGDKGRPEECKDANGNQVSGDACNGQHQNSGEPGYEPYSPKIRQAYMRYAFDYCIVEAGRRARNWGIGAFLDSGADPFETSASLYDGLSCDINIQKASTLGFKVGYDKLAETGTYVVVPPDTAAEPRSRRFGANDTSDDLDQYFFTIEYDDRKANAGESFTKQIGVYFAQVNGAEYKVHTSDDGSTSEEVGGSGTDLKFLDLYTGFYFADLSLRNEVLFRMGKSADPNWANMGGDTFEDDGNPTRNKLDAIAVAGSLDWTLSRSGAAIGPAEYNRGDASRHVLFLNYAYAPGDEDGYLDDRIPGATGAQLDESFRDKQVKSIALNRNFKPALILFNSRPEADKYIVDGAFNPSRVVNASVFGTGYRYESLENGNFEVKLVTAQMVAGPPSSVKDYYNSIEGNQALDSTGDRPAGFYGKGMGYELDLSYSYKVGREAELGAAAGAAAPGDAWKTNVNGKPVNNFLMQTYAAFKF
jgi:hypothetical protein